MMCPPPLRLPLTLEGLSRRIDALEDDRRERELNDRKTIDRQSHEISQAIEAAVAHVASPRFGRVDADNAELLASARRSEQERERRITAEIQLKSIHDAEEAELARKIRNRKHVLAVAAVLTPIVLAILGLIGAAMHSHGLGQATPPETQHHEGRP